MIKSYLFFTLIVFSGGLYAMDKEQATAEQQKQAKAELQRLRAENVEKDLTIQRLTAELLALRVVQDSKVIEAADQQRGKMTAFEWFTYQ